MHAFPFPRLRRKRAYLEGIATTLEAMLGEPPEHARRLARAHLRYRHQALVHWHRFANAPEDAVRKMTARVRFEEEQLFRALVTHDPRPLIYASLHMGNYLAGYHRITQCLPRERRLCVLRRLEASETEARAFTRYERLGVRISVLRQSERPTWQALEALRNGDHLVTFCDLPSRFGPTTTVEFLRHPMALVRAPAELAARTGALIVPLVNYVDDGGIDHLAVASPIATDRVGVRARRARVDALSQQLVSLAERWVRTYPAQWTNWHLLPEMLPNLATSGGDENNPTSWSAAAVCPEPGTRSP